MKSMGFNFIKRAVIIPAVIAVVAVAAVLAAVRFAPPSQQVSEQDVPALPQVRRFESISTLEEGDYIGTLAFKDGVKKAVTYTEPEYDTLVALKGSANPWQAGSLVIKGSGASAQLGDLRHLQKGNTFTFDVIDHGAYIYKITGIKYGESPSDLNAYIAKNDKKPKAKMLYICRSYNDFATAGKTKLYVVYEARQTGGSNG